MRGLIIAGSRPGTGIAAATSSAALEGTVGGGAASGVASCAACDAAAGGGAESGIASCAAAPAAINTVASKQTVEVARLLKTIRELQLPSGVLYLFGAL